jgi:hypothetical protein
MHLGSQPYIIILNLNGRLKGWQPVLKIAIMLNACKNYKQYIYKGNY